MDKETMQYVEEKGHHFILMKDALKEILILLESDVKIIESDSLNKERFAELVSKAEALIP